MEQDNRRKHPRILLSIDIDFSSAHNFFTGRTRDISVGGVFIETDIGFPVGTRLTLELHLLGASLNTEAEVAWGFFDSSGDTMGLGLRFVHLSEAMRTSVEAFMALREPINFDVESSASSSGELRQHVCTTAQPSIPFVQSVSTDSLVSTISIPGYSQEESSALVPVEGADPGRGSVRPRPTLPSAVESKGAVPLRPESPQDVGHLREAGFTPAVEVRIVEVPFGDDEKRLAGDAMPTTLDIASLERAMPDGPISFDLAAGERSTLPSADELASPKKGEEN